MRNLKDFLSIIYSFVLKVKATFGLTIIYTFGAFALVFNLLLFLSTLQSSFPIISDCSSQMEQHLSFFGDLCNGLDTLFGYCENKIIGRKLTPKERMLAYPTIVGIPLFIIFFKRGKSGNANAPTDTSRDTSSDVSSNPDTDITSFRSVFPNLDDYSLVDIDLLIQYVETTRPDLLIGKSAMVIFTVIFKTYIESDNCPQSFLTDIQQFYEIAIFYDPQCSAFTNANTYVIYLLNEQPKFFVDFYMRTMNTNTSQYTYDVIKHIYFYAYKRNL